MKQENSSEQLSFQDAFKTPNSIAKLVEHDVALMMHHRRVYNDFRSVFFKTDSEALRFGHFFFNAIWSWYRTYMLIAIRASIDSGRESKNAGSIIGLLHRIENAAEGMFTEEERSQAKSNRFLLKQEAENLFHHTSKLVAHRDLKLDVPSIDEHEMYRVLDLIGTVLEQSLDIIFGTDRPKLIVDVDPYWTQNLFGFAWGSPSPFIERLALGRDALFVQEGQERDFTPQFVYHRRPTDAALAERNISREDYERQRDDS